MKRTGIFLGLIFLGINLIYGQNYTISGYINNNITGEKLIGAYITEQKSGVSTSTNEYGFYSLTIKNVDTAILVVNFLSYIPAKEIIPLKNDIEKNIEMKSSDKQLSGVVITGKNIRRTDIGVLDISSNQISLVPSLAGEKDLFKTLQLLPGVMQGQDGKSGLFVRGSSPDQNLVLLDDISLYYVGHLGDFLSVFNDDAINSVKLIKGSIPARYGGRLSSVTDIRMKDGDLKNYHVSATLGIISSKIQINGPIIKDKMSFLISARRTWLDFLHPLVKIFINDNFMNYKFYDLNGKIRYKINPQNTLFLSFYNGNDKVENDIIFHDPYFENMIKQSWGNLASSLRWNHIFTNKLFSNFTLAYSKFNYSNYELTASGTHDYISERSYTFYSSIADLSSRLHFEYNLNNNLKFNFGLNSIYHAFSPAKIDYFLQQPEISSIDTTYSNNKTNSFETAGYFEAKLFLWNFFDSNFGLRFNNYNYSNTNYHTFEPRILLNLIVSKNSSLKFSYTYLEQNIHILSFAGLGLYSDLWVPSTENIPPEKVWQVSSGFEHNFLDDKINLKIEAYYKKMSNLLDFGYGTFWNNALNWEQKSEKNGEGICYGIEFLISKNYGRLTGWIAYTYSKSKRKFDNINSGEFYNYDYDRPNDFKIFVSYKLNDNFNFSANWIFESARPINLPIGSMTFLEITSFTTNGDLYVSNIRNFFYDKNSIRLNAYHRLDIAINYTKEKKKTTRIWSFSIYNVYNRQNPFYYFFDYQRQIDGTYKRKLFQQSLFPIIPSLSYTFKF